MYGRVSEVSLSILGLHLLLLALLSISALDPHLYRGGMTGGCFLLPGNFILLLSVYAYLLCVEYRDVSPASY